MSNNIGKFRGTVNLASSLEEMLVKLKKIQVNFHI